MGNMQQIILLLFLAGTPTFIYCQVDQPSSVPLIGINYWTVAVIALLVIFIICVLICMEARMRSITRLESQIDSLTMSLSSRQKTQTNVIPGYVERPSITHEDLVEMRVNSSRLTTFANNLNNMSINMRLFSLCMRSLYTDMALGTSTKEAIKMNKLRDDTRKDALVYVHVVLPYSSAVIRSIKQFFESYQQLNVTSWIENLPDMVQEVRGYIQCCAVVVNMHKEIIVPLKKREDDAKILISELECLTEQYKQCKKQLEASAANKTQWALLVLFAPGIGLVASPILKMSAETDLAKAVATDRQCAINQSAISVVSDSMIPAISALVDCIDGAAGFFSIIQQDLISFEGRGKRAIPNKTKAHYEMMKSKASEIVNSCREFYAMMPAVETDLQCIPEKPDDQNYVEKWLINQQKKIMMTYAADITNELRSMVRSVGKKAHQLMREGKKYL